MTTKASMPAYPPVIVSVFHIDDGGTPPFIYRVNGRVTVNALAEIEAEILSDDAYMGEGPGDYVFSVSRFEGQYDEYGRCEFPPGWEINFESFVSLAALEQQQE